MTHSPNSAPRVAPDASETESASLAAETQSPRGANARVQPIGLLYAIWNAELDIRLSERVALGGSFAYFTGNTTSTYSQYYQAGLVATYHLSNACFDTGWFGRLGAYVLPVHASRAAQGTFFVGTNVNVAGGGSFGYEWMWLGHFTAGLGVGVSYFKYSRLVGATAANGAQLTFNAALGGGWQPTLEASAGYAF